VTGAGEVVGEHRGLPFYTVGQRTGLGLHPRTPDAAPLYVRALDAARNTVVVGPRAELLRTRAISHDATWISPQPPPAGTECTVQLRAHGAAHDAAVENSDGSALTLRFDPPVAQVSPGQSMVLYRGDEVLGGGTVAEAA
jgi:tRNA-specific 2-thiouridylase